MTHNGSAYRSSAYALSCRRLDLRHLPTRPYRPRTNGKAERFSGRSCASGLTYGSTEIARSGWRRCRVTTTAHDHAAASAARRPELDSPN
jgi:transposase InsO family protein